MAQANNKLFFLSGFNNKEKSALTKKLQSLGGHISYMLTRNVTHIIFSHSCDETEREKVTSTKPPTSVIISTEQALSMLSETQTITSTKQTTTTTPTTPTSSLVPEPLAITSSVPNIIQSNYKSSLVLFGNGFSNSNSSLVHVKIGAQELANELIEVYCDSVILIKRIPIAMIRSSISDSTDNNKKPNIISISVSNNEGKIWSKQLDIPLEIASSSRIKEMSQISPEIKEFRVFLSSTFRDFQIERDEFMKNVMPFLRKQCRDRDIIVSCVDLRWGITSSQSSSGTSLLLCLNELERSSLLIGFLGERYGFHDTGKNSDDDKLMQHTLQIASRKYPQVLQFPNKSMTEIEQQMVLCGHFDIPAWFYIRESSYIETLGAFDRHNFESEGSEPSLKMSALKKQIAESGFPCRMYSQPSELPSLLQKDLSCYLNSHFTTNEKRSQFDEQSAIHRGFSNIHRQTYLVSEDLMFNLDKHVFQTGRNPLVVIGESGKSALLANWSARHHEHCPEDLIFEHFIGCNSLSTNAPGLLRRAMTTFASWFGWKDPIPETNEELIPEFSVWLERVAKTTSTNRAILIIDGLQNIEDIDCALDLLWLPCSFPDKIRVILSTGTGRPLEAIAKRNWTTITIPLFKPSDVITLSRMVLAQNSKRLNEKQEFHIIESTQTSSPLWLRAFLSEIVIFGDYEDLDSHIDRLLGLYSVEDLYKEILERLRKDFDPAGVGFVSLFFTSLWASRKGLLQSELEEILSSQGFKENELHALLTATEDLIFSCGGLLMFLNDKVSPAIKNLFCFSDAEQQFAHETLANFFATKISTHNATPREYAELAWQLGQCKLWSRLTELLTDIEAFLSLFSSEEFKYLLLKLWRELSSLKIGSVNIKQSFIKMLNTYVLDTTTRFGEESIKPKPFIQSAIFLEEIGQYEAAEETYLQALKYCPKNDILTVTDINSSLARLYEREAKYNEAENILENQLKLNPPTNELDLARSLNRLGAILTKSTKLIRAEECLIKALNIRERLLGSNHSRVGQTLKHMISLYEATANYQKAKECGLKALKITADSLGPTSYHVSTILLKLGTLYNILEEHSESESCFTRALSIRVEKYGKEHALTAEVLHNFAHIYVERENWTKAEEFFLEALSVMKKTPGMSKIEIARIQLRLAEVYRKTNRFNEAESLLLESLKTRKEILGENNTRVGQSLKHLVALYVKQGKYIEAEKCGVEALAITEKTFGAKHFHTSSALLEMGKLRKAMGRMKEAEQDLRRALEIRNSTMNEGAANVEIIVELADLLCVCNRKSEAMSLIEEIIPNAVKYLGQTNPTTMKLLSQLSDLKQQKINI